MEGVFLQVLNLSITVSYLILFILILRMFLKKTPRWITCALWALVAIRLVFPFSLESIFSLIPSKSTFDPEHIYSTAPIITSGIDFIDAAVNPVIVENFTPITPDSPKPMLTLTSVASIVWVAGLVLICLYGIISYAFIRRCVIGAVRSDDGVWQSEGAPTPFILGIVRPKIYIPFGIDEESRTYVIAHERSHLKRCDHLVKPIGFCLLAVYWFNPLVWISYVLLCRDIELACDEKVIRDMDETSRKAYATALLNCGAGRKRIAACPLAFGEVGVKERVKGIMTYKKPAFLLILLALVACICTAVFFLTSPKDDSPGTQQQTVFGTNDFEKATLISADTDTDSRVSILVNDISVRNGTPRLDITIKNNSGLPLMHGSPYSVYYISDGEKIDCDHFADQRVWTSIAYVINPGGTKDAGFTMDSHDLSKKGIYRFELKFNLGDDYETDYTAWVEFELEENLPAIKLTAYEYEGTSAEATATTTQYFKIIHSTSAELADFTSNCSFDISITEDSAVKINLSKPLELDGVSISEFILRNDIPVTLITPETGGGAKYVFEITDMPESELDGADTPGFVMRIGDIPTYDEVKASISYVDVPAFTECAVFSGYGYMEYLRLISVNPDSELPIVVCRSYEAFEELLLNTEYPLELNVFKDVSPKEFFKEKALLISAKTHGYSVDDFTVREILISSNCLVMTCDSGSVGNAVGVTTVAITAVDKEHIKNCTEFSSYFGVYYGYGEGKSIDFNDDRTVGYTSIRTHTTDTTDFYNNPDLWALSEHPEVCDIAAEPIIYKIDNGEELETLKTALSPYFEIHDPYTIEGYNCDISFVEATYGFDYDRYTMFIIFDPGQNSGARFLLDTVNTSNGRLSIRYSGISRYEISASSNRFIIVAVEKDITEKCFDVVAERGNVFNPFNVDCYSLNNEYYIIFTTDTEALIHLGTLNGGFKRFTYTLDGEKLEFTSAEGDAQRYTFEKHDGSLYVLSSRPQSKIFRTATKLEQTDLIFISGGYFYP